MLSIDYFVTQVSNTKLSSLPIGCCVDGRLMVLLYIHQVGSTVLSRFLLVLVLVVVVLLLPASSSSSSSSSLC